MGILSHFLAEEEIEYKEHPSQYYYQLRKDLKWQNSTSRAARFIALNRTCYNGPYRVNSQGLFNVPWGKYNDPQICNSKNLRSVSLAFQYTEASIKLSSYNEMLEKTKEGDFIYLDHHTILQVPLLISQNIRMSALVAKTKKRLRQSLEYWTKESAKFS